MPGSPLFHSFFAADAVERGLICRRDGRPRISDMLVYVPSSLFARVLAPEAPSLNIRDSSLVGGMTGSRGLALMHNSWGDWVTQGRVKDSEVRCGLGV